MTPEDRAHELLSQLSGVGDCVDDSAKKIEQLVIAALKDHAKEQRRQIHDRILLSSLVNKEAVTAVIFPPTPPKKEKWVDLSKD